MSNAKYDGFVENTQSFSFGNLSASRQNINFGQPRQRTRVNRSRCLENYLEERTNFRLL